MLLIIICSTCNHILVEKEKYVEVLAAVDTTRQRDFGGMRVLQSHKGGKGKGPAQALKVEEKQL